MINPYEPSGESPHRSKQRLDAEPICVYTASSNFDAHAMATWLESNDIPAYAVEDVAGTNVSILGSVNQFHAPQVFVERTDVEAALPLIRQFEVRRRARGKGEGGAEPLKAECEECGALSEFPASQNGTTQNCPTCGAYMDVGLDEWSEGLDFDAVEEEIDSPPETLESAVSRARELDASGEWQIAIEVYRSAAETWPDEAIYLQNCIAEIQRKIDAAEG